MCLPWTVINQELCYISEVIEKQEYKMKYVWFPSRCRWRFSPRYSYTRSLVSRPFRFLLTILGWYFERVRRFTDVMGGKREGLAQFANLPFLARFLSFQKQYILNIYNDIFVKLMKYICWQVLVRVTLCDSFHTYIRCVSSYNIKPSWRISLGNLGSPAV